MEIEYGWAGSILRVDLGKEKTVKQALDEALALKYIGGRGLNLKLLYDELKPGTDPLGPENIIIFGVGPCNGTIVPGSNRFTVTTKSPITGFIGDGNCGGSFGPELKYAGYDAVIFYGKADKPLYIWINDDEVELRDAKHLWSKNTWETQRMIREDTGNSEAQVVAIGPAGENLVKFANIITGLGRGAGRPGVGAVMGSKLLKAVAVRGTKGVKVANPLLLEKTVMEITKSFSGEANPWPYGTVSLTPAYSNSAGCLAIRNYQTGTLREDIKYLSPEQLPQRYYWKMTGCASCTLGCNRFYVIDKGPFAGTYGDGLELSLVQQYGSRIGNLNWDLILKLNTLVDQYGMDACDTGGVIGFTMECYEKGILTEKDVDGLKPEWGNQDAILNLVRMIAYRRGFGNILAEGIKRTSEIVGRGSEKYALHVKGIGFCTVDPRAVQSWGLGYAVSSRGACHMRACVADAYGYMPYGQVSEGKGKLVAYYENIRAVEDSLEVCKFIMIKDNLKIVGALAKGLPMPVTYQQALTKLYNSVTGVSVNSNDLVKVGERIVNLERAFNIREGLTRKDDTLPERFLKEPMPEGPAKGHVTRLESMLDEYYEKRGWSEDTGFPTKVKLTELGLKEVAEELIDLGRKLK